MGNKLEVAVIPVAGKGTRWLPVSYSVAKELLPVWNRTASSYAVQEAIDAGCREIIFVISADKWSVFEHFEAIKRGELCISDVLGVEIPTGESISFRWCEQESPLGLGHAVLCAENLVAGRRFGLLLPDEVLMSNGLRLLGDESSILLMEVGESELSRYGIVGFSALGMCADGRRRIVDLVEKPSSVQEAPSRFAVTGRYVLESSIFDDLRKTLPGLGGEIQLTDALRKYCKRVDLWGIEYRGVRHDVGRPMGLLGASVHFALRDSKYGGVVKEMLAGIMFEEQ